MLQDVEEYLTDEGYLAGLMERSAELRPMYSRFRKGEWRTKAQAWRVGYRAGYRDGYRDDRVSP
jgi:hypothetical protein